MGRGIKRWVFFGIGASMALKGILGGVCNLQGSRSDILEIWVWNQ